MQWSFVSPLLKRPVRHYIQLDLYIFKIFTPHRQRNRKLPANKMERLKKGVAVVTGSSSGIGEAVSEALVQHGLTVVGLARRQNKLQVS